ncbi:unnamed protein product [Psylliodes chrysocephalus]|uniref:Uncharacterized protein n=1 Tax=Psylliodes chrysocephalus TaxID=3402493 RepID=A0A9P0GDE0_9CUCU|nr:unnamed protein product [Psylliodes chrysocephala]
MSSQLVRQIYAKKLTKCQYMHSKSKIVYICNICKIWRFAYIPSSTHKHQIETIQNKVLRICAYKMGYIKGDYSYASINSQLNLKSLDFRRTVSDIIFINKLLTGNIDSPQAVGLINFNTFSRTRQFDLFNIPIHTTNYAFNSPVSRMLRECNKLKCKNCDIFGIINALKTYLNNMEV